MVIQDGRVLLVRRAQEPLKGEWSLPGGAVEVGETLREAIRREVQEETHLEVEVGPVVEVLERIRHDPDRRVQFHYVLVDFVCRPRGGSLQCASDADGAVWADTGELRTYRVAESTIEVIEKALVSAPATWEQAPVAEE